MITLQKEVNSKKTSKKYNMQDLILKAPTWTESDFKKYNKAKNHLNNSRIA